MNVEDQETTSGRRVLAALSSFGHVDLYSPGIKAGGGQVSDAMTNATNEILVVDLRKNPIYMSNPTPKGSDDISSQGLNSSKTFIKLDQFKAFNGRLSEFQQEPAEIDSDDYRVESGYHDFNPKKHLGEMRKNRQEHLKCKR